MAAIGAIRKHGVLLMVIIGIALLSFLVGDFNKLTAMFSDKNTMLKIDGKKVDQEYREQYEQNLSLWKIRNNKSTLEESDNYKVHEETYSKILDKKTLEIQLEKIGVVFTKEMIDEFNAEMIASLKSDNPNQALMGLAQYLAQNGNMEQAISIISSIEEYKDREEAKEIYNAYKAIENENVIQKMRLTYLGLAYSSMHFSKNMLKQIATANNTALAKFLTINPNAPAFKNIKAAVSEKEMKEYYKNNKKRFVVKKDARDIDIALFNVVPSANDLKTIEDSVRAKFTRLTNAASLVDYNIMEMEGVIDSVYLSKAEVGEYYKIDTLTKLIFNRPVGTYIEPFNYQGAIWIYGKSYGSKIAPDSVQVALLIVDYKTNENQNGTRTKEQAKSIADSLKTVMKSGNSDIFKLTPSYLGGRQAKDSLIWISERSIEKATFNSFLSTAVNDYYIQDAPNAYIVFKVVSKTGPIEKRQFVLYSKEIKPSDATIKNFKSKANELRATCSTADQLVEEANKRGLQVIQGKDITSMMASVNNVNNVREAVSWAFNPETEKDAVSDVFNYDNKMFYVATVRTVKEVGTPDFEDVKDVIEAQLLQEKKLEMISKSVKDQLSKGITLEQLAQNYQTTVTDSAKLSFTGESFQNSQIENSAIGKVFNLTPGKADVVIGTQFAYAVQIYSINPAAAPSANFQIEEMMTRNIVFSRSRPLEVITNNIKDNFKILDQRFLFYAK
jgi:peptidyl-prolyl cis-trans isomerase D